MTRDERDKLDLAGSDVCLFVSCPEQIGPEYDLCYQHNRRRTRGTIDECPNCGRYKERRYQICANCHDDEVEVLSDVTGILRESSPSWSVRDATASKFYVYILKLDGGEFYPGQTRELRERLSEHNDGRVSPTAGRTPKLVWFKEVPSREQATDLEYKLKKLVKRDQREIRRLVTDFLDLVREIDHS